MSSFPQSNVTEEAINSDNVQLSRAHLAKGAPSNTLINGVGNVNGLSGYAKPSRQEMDYRSGRRVEPFTQGFRNNSVTSQHDNGGYWGNSDGPGQSFPRGFTSNSEGSRQCVYNQYLLGNRAVPPSQRIRMCRFGQSCGGIGRGCEFGHEVIQKFCRFGVGCNRKNTCLFLHETNERNRGASDQGNDSKNQPSRFQAGL